MKFEPIKIKIKDLKLFAAVSLVIDSPIFIKEANSLRKLFQINKPLREARYQSWIIKNIIEARGKRVAGELLRKTDDIMRKLYLSANYQTVVEKAVFGCDILPRDFEIAPLIDLEIVSEHPELYSLGLGQTALDTNLFAILLAPQAREKDVLRAYKKYRKLIEESAQDFEAFWVENNRDYRGEIKRDRMWYWKKQEGKTYLQIAKEDEEKLKVSIANYKETVRKGVKAYEKALSPHFTKTKRKLKRA